MRNGYVTNENVNFTVRELARQVNELKKKMAEYRENLEDLKNLTKEVKNGSSNNN